MNITSKKAVTYQEIITGPIMFYRTYLVASKHTTLKQILTDFMRLSVKDTVVLSIPRKNTLGARDFSCAVSGLCQIFMATCAKKLRHLWLRPSADTEDSRKIW